MNITVDFFVTPNHTTPHFRIGNLSQLTGKEAATIRKDVLQLIQSGTESIYLDATDVVSADLSGINEIIHTHYVLMQAGKQFVLAYRQHSEMEKWVRTIGLDRFIFTAIVPA
jgi:anti-anti-sigma regulatory factor